jgi:histidine triad (HIT) family protein
MRPRIPSQSHGATNLKNLQMALPRPTAFGSISREMDFYCDEILSGNIEITRVAETGNVLAFHHTRPYWPVHIVIIPKRHIPSLAEFAPGDLPVIKEMLAVAADLCARVTAEHGGCRLSTNCGDHQTTKHLHFYIHSGARIRDESGAPAAH